MHIAIIILLAISIIVDFDITLKWNVFPYRVKINIFPIIILILYLIIT